MFNLSLTACSFWIQKLNSRKLNNIYSLNKSIIIGNDKHAKKYNNVLEMFKGFFEVYKNSISDEINKKTFSCEYKDEYKGETPEYYYMYAIINSGIYGSASDITDINTQKVTYKRKSTEADVRPFYLFIVIPKDSIDVNVQKGMLFFQNFGNFGVKTITTNYIRQHFSKEYGMALKSSTIAPSLFIEKVLIKDNIKKLIMVKNHKSNDPSDNFASGYGVETRVIANLSFNDTVWKGIINNIQYFVKGKFNLFEFESRKYDNLKLNVDIGGRERIINLQNLENLSIIEGIPEDIKMQNGHPDKKKLIAYFNKVAEEYLEELVVQIR